MADKTGQQVIGWALAVVMIAFAVAAVTAFLSRSDRAKARTVAEAPVTDPRQLALAADGEKAAIYGSLSADMPVEEERGLAIYVRETYTTEYNSSTSKQERRWKTDATETPVFTFRADGRDVSVVTDDYEIDEGTVHEEGEQVFGSKRYRGFAPGDSLLVYGTVIDGALAAENLFAGSRDEYAHFLAERAATHSAVAWWSTVIGLVVGVAVAGLAFATRGSAAEEPAVT